MLELTSVAMLYLSGSAEYVISAVNRPKCQGRKSRPVNELAHEGPGGKIGMQHSEHAISLWRIVVNGVGVDEV